MLILLSRLKAPHLAPAWPILSTMGLLLVGIFGRQLTLSPKSYKFALFLGIAAVTLSLKIYFNAVFSWFGFYLLVPGTIFLAVLSISVLPQMLSRSNPGAFVLRWASILLIGCISIQAAMLSMELYDKKTLALGEGPDRSYVFDDLMIPGRASPRLIKELVSRLQRIAPPEATLLAIPEGLLVNYLLRLRNPTPFLQTFIAKTIYDVSGGDKFVLQKLQLHPPDYVLYLHRAPEFAGPVYQIRGPSGFANAPLSWIDGHYTEIDRIGPKSSDFNELVSVLLKKDMP